MKKQLFKGRPDFPDKEPTPVPAGQKTNSVDEVYIIYTQNQTVTLDSGMKQIADDGTKSASKWAGKSFTGVMYGRWTNVGATDAEIAVYFVDPANSES